LTVRAGPDGKEGPAPRAFIFYMRAQLKPITNEERHLLVRKGLRKICPLCDECVPIVMFGVCRARKDGRNLYCKSCIRQKVSEFRQRHKDYRKAEWKRKQRATQAASQTVLEYLEEHGEATQKQIHNGTGVSLSEIDIALTELLITRRCVGTRALTDHTRLYFCL
jgi:hypothetical protein